MFLLMDGQEYGQLKESMKATEMKAKSLAFAQKVHESGRLCGVFQLFRDHTECFIHLLLRGVGK